MGEPAPHRTANVSAGAPVRASIAQNLCVIPQGHLVVVRITICPRTAHPQIIRKGRRCAGTARRGATVREDVHACGRSRSTDDLSHDPFGRFE